MTDEQIKQNAGRFASRGRGPVQTQKEYELLVEGYISGAHSRDEEIKELNGQVTLHKERADYYHDLYMKLRNDNKDLEQALACAEDVVDTQRKELDQLRNPWISVEERLPEEGQAVIVRLAFGEGNHAVCNYSNGQFVWALCIEASNVNIQSMLKLPAITNWMPIPDVPKV